MEVITFGELNVEEFAELFVKIVRAERDNMKEETHKGS